ncbi:MAG TPA: hypothetical protein VLF18_13610 [Tahibacter sp.]|uniref:hypothetical protein n=1 Tax=Tahibacter sp. TaxID=2056211 RepID=UPI002C38337B|nr:hypothetical protein [Tahibacter sp.]HSX61231.1 hypothetical protein [Tahibacter sp.]
MGSVHRAQRVDGIERQVAVTIARRDLLNDTALARFRVERQVFALLQHPQIAAMYDVELALLADQRAHYRTPHLEVLSTLRSALLTASVAEDPQTLPRQRGQPWLRR